MKTRGTQALRLLAIASLLGCYNLTGRTVADGGDAAEEPRADASDASDVSDVSDVTDLGDVVDATDSADALDVADVEDAPDVSDAAEAGCDGGAVMCEGACVDLATTTAHCGRCDNACPARANATVSCVAGACALQCSAGFADCDGDASNGCEAPLSSVANCGGCGARCDELTPLCGEVGGDRRCVSGCAASETRCAMSCVNTASDAANCGRCGNACATGATCSSGVCVCSSGQSDCHGVCRETGASCVVGRGACMRTGVVVCEATGTETQCSVAPGVAGTETCNGIDDDCDGLTDEGFCRIAGSCYVDGQMNPANNCQTCVAPSTMVSGPLAWGNVAAGTTCRAAAGVCDVAEVCDGTGAVCPANAFQATTSVCRVATGACDAAEVCTGSSVSCPVDMPLPAGGSCTSIAGGACAGFVCACPSGQSNCGGTCRATQSDVMNCGACGRACAAGESCRLGVCAGTRTLIALHSARLQCDRTGTWSQDRLAATADYADDGPRNVGSYGYFDGSGFQGYSNARLGLVFPPLDLPAGARVTSARIEVLPLALANVPPQVFRVVTFNPGALTRFTAEDYGIDRWGSVSLGEEPNTRFSAMVRHAITLNAAGIAALSRTDPNVLGLRSQYDLDDVVPANRAPGGYLVIAPSVGMPEDATLVVDYDTACASCPARAHASPTCDGSTCGYACDAGYGDCDGSATNGCEVDLRVSTANCGGCGMTCGGSGTAAAMGCVNSRCTCASGRADCDGSRSNGCEQDITNDAHCGTCSTTCIPGAIGRLGTTCVWDGAAYVCSSCGGGGGSVQQRCCASGVPCASGLTCGSSPRGPGICP